MRRRFLASIGSLTVVIAFVWLMPVPVAGQVPTSAKTTAKAYTPPRTANGHPDLQGVWDFRNVIPLERPSQYASKEFLSDQEAAEFEKSAAERLDMDRRDDDPTRTPAVVNGAPATADVARAYNEFWYDFGKKFVGSKRSSLIVDPPDGKIPPLTPEAKKRADEYEERRARPASGPEDLRIGERCLMGFNAGPPMLPGAYNNNVQLFQTRDNVVILTEMVHNARVVPLDGRPHVSVPQWSGSSRGHWEGDTLVVETKGFYQTTSFPNSSPNMHLIEKFSRVGPDNLLYEFTVSDATTWTKPFTAQIPMRRSDQSLFEYACHEGNYGMKGILSAARAIENAAGEGAKKGSR
jgi:hypothetical protein